MQQAALLSTLTLLFATSSIAACTTLGEESAPGPEEPAADPGPTTPTEPDGVPGARRMVAYYASWDTYDRNYQVTSIPASQLTTINYAFLNISDAGECVLGDAYADVEKAFPGDPTDPGAVRGNIHQLQLLKQAQPQLEVLLSVGGWTWSTRFSDVALTAAGRTRFAQSCAALVARYGLDGLDVDWEFPGGGGLAPGRPEDTQNFTLLLAALRAELGAAKRLTIAAPAGPAHLARIEIAKIAQLVDWVNLMAYDFHGTFEMATNFSAPLNALAADRTPDAARLTVRAAVDAWLAGGVPGAKLVLGMPLYGYGWTGVPATRDGLLQPAAAAAAAAWGPGKFDYRELAATYLPAMTRRWSDEAKAPWLYDPARGLMIAYDDAQSLAAKTQLVRSKALGGAMFWELSSDDAQGTLVRAVREVLLR